MKCGVFMLEIKFIDNIKKGLGSAYIELCNARDKEEYRDSLVYSITHSCTYDFIYEGSKGNFLYEMIGLFDDKNYFIDIVENKLLNDYSINIDLQSQLLDILMADYYLGNEEVKYIIEEYYNNFIKIGRWTKRKIECYSYLCIKMSKLFGLKRVKLILKDWERYNINPSDYWFGTHIQFTYKKQNLIAEANKEDFIAKNYNHTFDEFLYLINNQEFVYCFSSFATDYENEKCNKYLEEI